MQLHVLATTTGSWVPNTSSKALLAGAMAVDSDTNAGGLVSAVAEVQNAVAEDNNQASYFDTLTDFLDFSENNPFGDASNN